MIVLPPSSSSSPYHPVVGVLMMAAVILFFLPATSSGMRIHDNFPDVIRCGQHFYYLNHVSSDDDEAIYFNNIFEHNRYAIIRGDKIVGSESEGMIPDCRIDETIEELYSDGNAFDIVTGRSKDDVVDTVMNTGFPDVIRCGNSFFFFTTIGFQDSSIGVYQYTNTMIAPIHSNRRELQTIDVSNRPKQQIIRVGFDNGRVISGEGDDDDVGECLERSIDELYDTYRAYNIVGSKQVDAGDSIASGGFPDAVRCSHIVYYLHTLDEDVKQVQYFNQDSPGYIAFDIDTKMSLTSNLPYNGCEGVDVEQFFDGSNSLYEGFNFFQDHEDDDLTSEEKKSTSSTGESSAEDDPSEEKKSRTSTMIESSSAATSSSVLSSMFAAALVGGTMTILIA